MLQHQKFQYIIEIIKTEIIIWNHNDSLAKHFKIDKTRKLMTRKYHWKILHPDVELYIKRYDVHLALIIVGHKTYDNL